MKITEQDYYSIENKFYQEIEKIDNRIKIITKQLKENTTEYVILKKRRAVLYDIVNQRGLIINDKNNDENNYLTRQVKILELELLRLERLMEITSDNEEKENYYNEICIYSSLLETAKSDLEKYEKKKFAPLHELDEVIERQKTLKSEIKNKEKLLRHYNKCKSMNLERLAPLYDIYINEVNIDKKETEVIKLHIK